MNKTTVLAFATLAAATLSAATVDRVVVRQQWPWSTDVKVEYRLSGMTSQPVDLTVRAFDGTTEFDAAKLRKALKGDVCGVTGSVGSFTFDPHQAFDTGKAVIDNLTVKIELSDSPADIDEVLYKIFNLTDGSCENVTRKAILNGEYGAYETDFAKIGNGFSTTLTNVLIWTGVTNNLAYKTDYLVMRKIPVGETWIFGNQTGKTTDKIGDESKHKVKLTEGYYIGVFELTQDQYHKTTSWPTAVNTNHTDSGIRPMENIRYDNALGVGSAGEATLPSSSVKETVCWPTNSYRHLCTYGAFISNMRRRTGVTFTLPTEAQWEFACRAGTATDFNNGKNSSTDPYVRDPNVEEVAWTKYSQGFTDDTAQTMPVGLKKPNAFGLYDMHGNVMEMCLDGYTDNIDVRGEDSETDPVVNPIGLLNTLENTLRIKRGGSFDDATSNTRYRSSLRNNYYNYNQACKHVGCRLVCPAAADWE